MREWRWRAAKCGVALKAKCCLGVHFSPLVFGVFFDVFVKGGVKVNKVGWFKWGSESVETLKPSEF